MAGLTLIGERINATRKPIARALKARDAALIAKEAAKQREAGADYIDVNAGMSPEREAEDLAWLVETVQAAVDAPCCIDTANPAALEKALAVHKGRALVNSITGEKERLEGILPLAARHKARLVALTMDDAGMPTGLAQREEVAARLAEAVTNAGLALEDLFFDPLVRPVSTNPEEVAPLLDAFGRLRERFGGCHATCGLSNISFGLPERRTLNRTFLVLAVARGLDAPILDPTEPGVRAALYAARALSGADEFCMEYVTAAREGRLV